MGKNVGQLCDGRELSITKWGERGGGGRVANGSAEVLGCASSGISGRELGHGTVVGKEFYCAGNTFGSRFGCIYAVTAIMVGRTAEVPALNTVDSPCAPFVGCFVNEDFGARRSKGGFVIIESSVELSFGGQTGVDAGCSQ